MKLAEREEIPMFSCSLAPGATRWHCCENSSCRLHDATSDRNVASQYKATGFRRTLAVTEYGRSRAQPPQGGPFPSSRQIYRGPSHCNVQLYVLVACSAQKLGLGQSVAALRKSALWECPESVALSFYPKNAASRDRHV